MRISNAMSRALTVSAAVAMLAGCSSGRDNSQMAPSTLGNFPSGGAQASRAQSTRDRINRILAAHIIPFAGRPLASTGFMSADAVHKPLIFVADGVADVDIYPQVGKNQKKMVGQIAGLNGAFGLATDEARNVYIVSNGNSGEVLVYAPPYTNAPKLTLDDSDTFPFGVAVSHRGVVGVANTCSAPSCPTGSANVSFFAKNSTTACATVADPTNFAIVFYDAFDHNGNLYIAGFDPSFNPVVGEVAGGCNATTITRLATTNTLGFPSGIQVDKADRIAILNGVGSTNVIDTYDAPRNGSLGNPVSTTPLTTTSVPIAFAFLALGCDVYTAEQGNGGVANEYPFPVGGTPEKTITVGGSPQGVAVAPALVP
jgi:hypothetical protein